MQVDGFSLNAQREKLYAYAQYQDMEVVGEFSDEGKSGKNIKERIQFQEMLSKIKDGTDNVSFVLVFKLSRFGINAADVLNSLQIMQENGGILKHIKFRFPVFYEGEMCSDFSWDEKSHVECVFFMSRIKK